MFDNIQFLKDIIQIIEEILIEVYTWKKGLPTKYIFETVCIKQM